MENTLYDEFKCGWFAQYAAVRIGGGGSLTGYSTSVLLTICRCANAMHSGAWRPV